MEIQKDLIISLIKDHIMHTRLMQGLEDLGIDAYPYHLHLGETIFALIKIEDEQDVLFKKYLRWCSSATKMKFVKHPELLEEYAGEIYEKLNPGSYRDKD